MNEKEKELIEKTDNLINDWIDHNYVGHKFEDDFVCAYIKSKGKKKCDCEWDESVADLKIRILEAIRTARIEAYEMFFKIIKESKNKFPNRREFELVVDVRDIENVLQALKGGKEKEV